MPEFACRRTLETQARRLVMQGGDSFTWRGCAHCDRAQRGCTPGAGLPAGSIVDVQHVVGRDRCEANGTGLAVRRRRPTQTLCAALARFESACSAGLQQTAIQKPAVRGGGETSGLAVPACAEQIGCAAHGQETSLAGGPNKRGASSHMLRRSLAMLRRRAYLCSTAAAHAATMQS